METPVKTTDRFLSNFRRMFELLGQIICMLLFFLPELRFHHSFTIITCNCVRDNVNDLPPVIETNLSLCVFEFKCRHKCEGGDSGFFVFKMTSATRLYLQHLSRILHSYLVLEPIKGEYPQELSKLQKTF